MSEKVGRKRRIGIRDVAERAGVGKTTAAYILNDEKAYRFTDETCSRVREAARELGYVPNIFAKGLKTGRSSLVGLYFDDFTTPELVSGGGNAFFVEFFASLCSEGIESGYFPVTLFRGQENHETNLSRLDKLLQAGIGGILMYRPTADMLEFLQGRVEKDFPRVSIFSQSPDHPDCVNLDIQNRGLGRSAAELLLEAGYRNVVMTATEIDPAMKLRRKGFTEVIEAAGLETRLIELPHLDHANDQGSLQIKFRESLEILRQTEADSYFCLNGVATGITTHLLDDLGVRYPDTGLIGIDVKWTARGQRITHFTAPWDRIAVQALKMIAGSINTGEPLQPERHIIEPRFVPGMTCRTVSDPS